MSRLDMFGLAFGAMIGWGWVVFAGDWIRIGGTIGASIAFVIGALMCITVGLVYGEMTSALPVAGGPVAFTYRGMGDTWSWITGWIMLLSYVSVAAFESVAVITALNHVVTLPAGCMLWTVAGEPVYVGWSLVGMLLSVVITLINVRGAKLSATAQSAGTALLLIAGAFFLAVSGLRGSPRNLEPRWVSVSGTASVLMMVPFMMVGFDVIPQSAEEARVPYRIIGQLLTLSVIAAAAWYIAIIFGLGYAIPAQQLESSQLAVFAAVDLLLSTPLWGKLMALGGLCGILTSWNAFLMAASRIIFSMGRARMLPPKLSKVHERTGTPTVAISIVGAICAIAPFFGRRLLVWLANVGGLCTCLTYFLVSVSFLRLRKSEPDLPRPFKAGRTSLIGVASVVITTLFISLYLPVGPSSLVWPYEWGMVLLWTLVGLVCYRVSRRSSRAVTDAERKRLIFGDL